MGYGLPVLLLPGQQSRGHASVRSNNDRVPWGRARIRGLCMVTVPVRSDWRDHLADPVRVLSEHVGPWQLDHFRYGYLADAYGRALVFLEHAPPAHCPDGARIFAADGTRVRIEDVGGADHSHGSVATRDPVRVCPDMGALIQTRTRRRTAAVTR